MPVGRAMVPCGANGKQGRILDRPCVSVVIPAYNSAWSITDTLRSVVGQTLRPIEIIIVDDGSTDELDQRLEPFLSDKRLRIVRQANAGLAAARNRGLRGARADLVGFIDADDLWHPEFLEATLDALARTPEAPFAYAFMVRIDMENRIVPTPLWSHIPRHDLVGLLEVNTVANGSAAVFRRRVIDKAGGFDEGLWARGAQGAEDWKLALQLAARALPVVVPRQLIGYRLSPQSMSRRRPDVQLEGIEAVITDIRREFPEVPERHFRNARTVLNGWLLPAFFANRRYRDILHMLWVAYGQNPLWFLSRDVRAVHWQKLISICESLRPRRALSDLVEMGRRPFAFLDGSRPQDPD